MTTPSTPVPSIETANIKKIISGTGIEDATGPPNAIITKYPIKAPTI